MAAAPPVLELRGITKEFPGVLANDRVDFDLRVGEVHGLLGENGAGKSTLMNILYGLYSPDAGEIAVNGETVKMSSPSDAIDRGIGMVHQHFMLIPVMTVAENIVLSVEPRHAGILLDIDAAEQRVAEISERYGLAVDPHARIQDITVGQQQRVEILKALYRGAEILVLDEPTAVLTPQEARELFEIIESLTDQGKSIIFITHKLNEALEIADRVTVLRRGKVIETLAAAGASEEQLAELMVGRKVLLDVQKEPRQAGKPLLSVKSLSVRDDRGLEKVRDVSFEAREGEILGVAGVDGNGQSELIDALCGLLPVERGSVEIEGEDVTGRSVHRHFDAGIGHIPEDRQVRGLVLDFSIAENIAIHDFREPPVSRWGWLYPRAMLAKARRLIKEFDVRGGSARTSAGSLSGGNQQKVILAREIDRNPRVMIAAQPTRGLDVGAIEFVHKRLIEERDQGRAILLVSLELEEILSMSDRILVLFEGRIVGEYPPTATHEELGVAMTGGAAAEAAA